MKKTLEWLLAGKRSRFLITMLIFMLVSLAFTLLAGAVCVRTAHAAPPITTETAPANAPEPTVDPGDISVSVDDVIAVSQEIKNYDTEVTMLAKLVYAEGRGIKSRAEQAAIIWVVLNRADARHQSIRIVLTARKQFAYRRRSPAPAKFKALARDVLIRWLLEKRGVQNVGRVLPKSYQYFASHKRHNWFRNAYKHGAYWPWELPSPYQ